MKLFYKLYLIGFLLLLSQQQIKAAIISGDTILYRQVVDSLIRIALKNNQLKPIVIISESKRLRKPKKLGDDDLAYIIRAYATDSINNARHNGDYKVLKNAYLRDILLSIKQFDGSEIQLPILGKPAQIRYKANGWAVFKSYERIKRYRKNNPEFFCVADITKPVFVGDYAIIVVDHQFNPLGGGGYMHIFKKEGDNWQTYALINLWNY